MVLEGVDVSVYQGGIDWNKVKHDGRVFAGIKATEGLYGEDVRFHFNWIHGHQAGIRCIAYHFLRPYQDGSQQANYFHNIVHNSGGFKQGDAIMLDLETTDGLDANSIVACAEAFVSNLLRYTHCGIYLYSGPYFWNNILGGPSSRILTRCALWQAAPNSEPASMEGWPYGPSIHQYSFTGGLNGITNTVDLDRFLGTQHQYDLLATNAGRM